MEFFDWMGIPQVILDYFRPNFATLAENLAYMRNLMFISMGIAGGLYLIAHVMGGFGLLEMSRRAGIKHGWIGFLPLGNTYLSGELAGETRVFGKKMKRAGLYAAIAEGLFIAVGILSLILSVKFLNVAYYSDMFDAEGNMQGWEFDSARVPIPLRRLSLAVDILTVIGELVVLFFFCILYFALFRKYYARSPFLMTFLCAVLPVRGFVLFAVRKNTPVDYSAYMQRRMQEYNAMRGNPPQGGYGPNGGYNGNGYGGGDSSPFSDFGDGKEGEDPPGNGSSDDSPFSDF